MFFVWFDGDRKRRPHLKLGDAVAEYRAKYGVGPSICLTHPTDATAIGEQKASFDFLIQSVAFVAVNTFYLGGRDAEEAMAELEIPAAELRQAA